MPKIFISYRRDDSSKDSARLYDRLRTEFGPLNVFKDLDSIPKGRPFINVIQDAIEESDVVLVIIGRVWASVAKNGQRRLDDPNDFVRREVEMALAAPHKRLVIPTLVDGATMPAATDLPDTLQRLPGLNAATIQDDPHFHTDVSRLIREIRAWKRPSRLPIVAIIGIIAIVAVVGLILLASQQSEPTSIDPIAAANTRAFAIQTETARAKAPTATPNINVTQTFEAQLTAIVATFTHTPTITPTPNITQTFEARLTAVAASFTDTPTPEPATPEPAGLGTPQERDFDGVTIVYVPAGCFLMGSNNGDSNEEPVHEVCITKPFWLDKYEVSNGQFNSKGGQAGNASRWTDANLPRETIDWTEANAFCQLRGARLPTEAEWEYAARGPEGLEYPWGAWDPNKAVWGWGKNSNQTAKVGSIPAGASWVGALDMSGNVWEWVGDWFAERYSSAKELDPVGPSQGAERVLRGGSWFDSFTTFLRGAVRGGDAPANWYIINGFRCARSL